MGIMPVSDVNRRVQEAHNRLNAHIKNSTRTGSAFVVHRVAKDGVFRTSERDKVQQTHTH
jgi:uncharacterized protein YoxC